MATDRLTITVVGGDDDDGHPRFKDLIDQLMLVHSALGNTERMITGEPSGEIYYRVVDASHNSPVKVVLEPIVKRKKVVASSLARNTVRKFVSNLRKIRRGTDARELDLQTLESYKKLGELLEKKSVTHLEISDQRSKTPVSIDRTFNARVDKIIGPDETSFGSVTGQLEVINLHNQNVFSVYPRIGPGKVYCKFDQALRPTVIESIDKKVTVFGKLRYKQRESFPYSVDVYDLQIEKEPFDIDTSIWISGASLSSSGGLTSLFGGGDE